MDGAGAVLRAVYGAVECGWSAEEQRGVKAVGLQREFLELRKLAE